MLGRSATSYSPNRSRLLRCGSKERCMMALHDPRTLETLTTPELQALRDAHMRTFHRIHQVKRTGLFGIGIGVGMTRAAVCITLGSSDEAGLGVFLRLPAFTPTPGALFPARTILGEDEPLRRKGGF